MTVGSAVTMTRFRAFAFCFTSSTLCGPQNTITAVVFSCNSLTFSTTLSHALSSPSASLYLSVPKKMGHKKAHQKCINFFSVCSF